mmetsp:Transcript_137856/g.195080  ORF Transcript_137856/g.195080 Transcript_137856/m.195080 type:complete len:89 (-) Transcript_137856:24-290(-)
MSVTAGVPRAPQQGDLSAARDSASESHGVDGVPLSRSQLSPRVVIAPVLQRPSEPARATRGGDDKTANEGLIPTECPACANGACVSVV